MKKIIIYLYLMTTQLLAQIPDPAFNPMTAQGARHICFGHKLFWENSSDLLYNEIFLSSDSNLVANMEPSVKIISGYDSSIVYDSLQLSSFWIPNPSTKYYWRVVEYNSFGYTPGHVWYFVSAGTWAYWEDYFDNGLSNYTVGSNWSISNTSFAGGNPPELIFNNSNFTGASYLELNEFFDLSPSWNTLFFNFTVDWIQGEFKIGTAYSLDEGETWISLWEQTVTEDIPNVQFLYTPCPNENYVRLTLFCNNTNQNSNGLWYIDDLRLVTPLSTATPPAQIKALADSLSPKVSLTWSPGSTVGQSWGYVIQRKSGLPLSSSTYEQIVWVGPEVLSFEDTTVQLDSTYTYRIQTREGPMGGWTGHWSNEATAYVPKVVPVELVSFSSNIESNNVTLNWITATETNNYGFEVEKSQISNLKSQIWEKIGFVSGKGTTTEQQFYSFTDQNLSAGKYQYRLKQIDFDGSFEYSNIIEVEIGLPGEFSLSQNFPNPFNPTTKIKYIIPTVETGHAPSLLVIIKVYDVLGNEVATLLNEEKSAGSYEVEFNSHSDEGQNLSSGIYFYQLKAGNLNETKKMILLR